MSKNKRRLFIVSNMYPSQKDVRYGIFVKRFEEAVLNDFEVHKLVLVKRKRTLSKLLGYIEVHLKIVLLAFFCRKSDIIYVHFPLYFSLALLFFEIRKIPVVLNFHGSDIQFEKRTKKFLKIFLTRAVRSAKKIVVPSAYYSGKIGNLFNVSSEKLFVYPSGGVSTELFYPIEKANNRFVFGFVSNFIEKKGWRIFLGALSILYKKGRFTDFSAIMVGDGPDKEEISEIVSKLDFEVKIMSYVPQHELKEIYGSFDLFIFPTYREEESLGLVGLEAMMCGVPIIASMVGGPMGYIEDEENGFLFKRKDIPQLVYKIECFLNMSYTEKRKMIERGLLTSKKYDSKLVKQDLLKMLKLV